MDVTLEDEGFTESSLVDMRWEVEVDASMGIMLDQSISEEVEGTAIKDPSWEDAQVWGREPLISAR